MTTYLLWTDYESTGLSPRMDEIIEAGVILTNEKLDELVRWHGVFVPSAGGFERILENEFVLNMHRQNGLWEEILDLLHDDDREHLWQFEEKIVTYLRAFKVPGEKVDIHIAGSGVAAFDLPFTRQHLPRLSSLLHYAPIDVGPGRRMWQWATGGALTQDEAVKNHRAMSDVEGHLREGRAIFEKFGLALSSGQASVDAKPVLT